MTPRLRFLVVVLSLLVSASLLFAQRAGRVPSSSARGTVNQAPMSPDVANPPTPRTRIHAEDEGNVTFKTGARMVLIPVVVTGKDGAPVLHLKKEDFQVTESGKAQTLASFEAYTTVATPLRRNTPKDIFTNEVDSTDPRRVSIIMLDALNTPFLDQTYARAELIKYLANSVDDKRVVALFALDQKGLHLLHDFTSDPGVLVAALKKVSSSLPSMKSEDKAALVNGSHFSGVGVGQFPGGTVGNDTVDLLMQFIQEGAETNAAAYQQEAAAEQTLEALWRLSAAYSGIAGKKSLIWVTGGFPFLIDDPSTVPSQQLASFYEQTMQRISDANIAIYPVDARGLVTNNFIDVPQTNGLRTSFRPRMTTAQLSAFSGDAEAQYEQEVRQTFDEIAQMTGGRVFASRNDLTSGYAQVDKDSSSYYVLGYYLDEKNTHAGWRKIKVKVNAPDAKLLYRSGFFVTDATVNAGGTKTNDVMDALHSPVLATGLIIRAKWLATKPDGTKRDVEYLMGVNPGSIAADDQGQIDLAMVGIVFDKDGKQVGTPFGRTYAASLTAEQSKVLAQYGVVDRGVLALDPGTYHVHFAVRDNKTGRIGTIIAPLTVQ